MSSDLVFFFYRRLIDESILLQYQHLLLLIERTLEVPHTPNRTECPEDSFDSERDFVALRLPHLYGFDLKNAYYTFNTQALFLSSL